VSPDPFVVCRALSKTYVTPSGGIEALHAVDATFDLGAITAVVGASGSGKSTLLRALAGLDRPTTGTLTVAGRELGSATPSGLRHHRRQTATYVNQKASDNFIPHLTLQEQTENHNDTAAALLERFGVAQRLGSLPVELSGGEQARAAFALALARGTPLLLADEPTAELDRASAQPLLDAIRAHAGSGTALVIATHDPDVIAIADRVLRFDHGRVTAEHKQPGPDGRSQPRVAHDTQVILEVSGVRKSYRRGSNAIHAVRDGTLTLARGQLGALVGRSGSGKSTLLTLLGGLQAPDAGDINYTLSATDPESLPWSELAFLPQRFGLLPELSIRENVQYPARLNGTLNQRSTAIETLLAQLGLAELANRPPRETSIGQQQRTALARALALQPDVLLADEPTSHQDAGWRDTVWQLLVEAAQSGTACLVATHEEAIARYANRVWTIDAGTTTISI
jgi:ABC-type lipoprotein export system ATPase subunit